MTFAALPDALRSLIAHHMATMDHVAVLVALHRAPEDTSNIHEVARETHLDLSAVDSVLGDLVQSSLVQRSGDDYRYLPPSELTAALDELVQMYETKPVTLIRAMYDRPARSVTSFADAFRVRKPN